MTVWVIGSSDDAGVCSGPNTTYATARDGAPTKSVESATIWGQAFNSPNYRCRETFMRFDVSALAGTLTASRLQTSPSSVDNASQGMTTEVREIDYTFPVVTGTYIPGADLGNYTLLGSLVNTSITAGVNGFDCTLSGTLTRYSDYVKMMVDDDHHRLGTAPTLPQTVQTFTATVWSLTVEDEHAVTIKQVVAASNGGGSTSVVFSGLSIAAGDGLIAIITARGTTNAASLSGFTEDTNGRATTANSRTTTLYKASATGSEGTSLTFTISSAKAAGVLFIVDGHATSGFITCAAGNNASSVNCLAPTVTPPTTGCVHVVYGGTDTGTTVSSWPAGMTPGPQATNSGGSGGTRNTVTASYQALVSASATGTRTTVFAAAAVNAGVAIIIQPAPAGPPAAFNPLFLAGD